MVEWGEGEPSNDDWDRRLGTLGSAIRAQRQLAQMSLRKLSELAQVSNPYLSQIERGLHEPSVRVLRSIARALSVSAEDLLHQAGMIDSRFAPVEASEAPGDDAARGNSDTPPNTATAVNTEAAIAADPNLTPEQREALLTVYRSYRANTR
jgi:transcriptional regulator with XRE-family HTH domain